MSKGESHHARVGASPVRNAFRQVGEEQLLEGGAGGSDDEAMGEHDGVASHEDQVCEGATLVQVMQVFCHGAGGNCGQYHLCFRWAEWNLNERNNVALS